jgi:hypothetical protein
MVFGNAGRLERQSLTKVRGAMQKRVFREINLGGLIVALALASP